MLTWFSPRFDNNSNYDEIRGHICETCQLACLHGYDQDELGYESASFSSAGIISNETSDHAGYFDCLICDETKIDGYPTSILVNA